MLFVTLVTLLIAASVIAPKVFAWFALAWTMWRSEPVSASSKGGASEWTPPPNAS